MPWSTSWRSKPRRSWQVTHDRHATASDSEGKLLMTAKKLRKREPGVLTPKIDDGREMLWFDVGEGGFDDFGNSTVCIDHRADSELCTFTIMRRGDPNSWTHLSRDMVRKLLPYLMHFAGGGDLGVKATKRKAKAK